MKEIKNDLLIRQKCEAMIEYGHVALRQLPKSVLSWVAHATHADAYGLRKRLLGTLAFTRR